MLEFNQNSLSEFSQREFENNSRFIALSVYVFTSQFIPGYSGDQRLYGGVDGVEKVVTALSGLLLRQLMVL